MLRCARYLASACGWWVKVSDSPFMAPGSRGDVAGLTGARTRKGQLRVLQQNGVRHVINASGWPVVLWSTVEVDGHKGQDQASWKSNKKAA